ncbi:phasin family protein [Psychrobacter sp. CAL346-MNA-CIBAN-0220]|uniref:phasin family protein n=1 Tax=Psychrobacter sp. CAL346-MNA-CIBAN-0220 TaxID=3140457 RepID=UPI003331829C
MSQSNPQDFFNQFNQFNGDTQKMFEPWNKLNKAFLKNAEMMSEFSLNTMKSYSEMGLENMRQVAGIDSPESAKDFNDKQAEMLNVISQKMLADAQRMTELGTSMHDEVMQVMGDVHGQTNEEMQANMQKAADQATKTGQEYAENMSKMAEQFNEQAAKNATNTGNANTSTANANTSTANAKTGTTNTNTSTTNAKTGTTDTKTGTAHTKTGTSSTGKSTSK